MKDFGPRWSIWPTGGGDSCLSSCLPENVINAIPLFVVFLRICSLYNSSNEQFIDGFLCARLYPELGFLGFFRVFNSSNPYNSPIPFFKMGKQSIESCCHLAKIIQLGGNSISEPVQATLLHQASIFSICRFIA